MDRNSGPNAVIIRAWKITGFTLLEILIAVFIFAVVMSTIFGTFNGVISRTDAIKNGMGGYEMARTCFDRMISDLTTIYLDQKPLYHPPDIDDPPDPYRLVGTESYAGSKNFSKLRFASTDHLSMNGKDEKGIAEIVYYIKEEGYPESEFVLKRSDTAYPYDKNYEFEEKDSDPVLCENIEEFSIKYFDQDGNETEKWDSDSDFLKYGSPKAVKIKLKLINNENSYEFETKIVLPIFREKFE